MCVVCLAARVRVCCKLTCLQLREAVEKVDQQVLTPDVIKALRTFGSSFFFSNFFPFLKSEFFSSDTRRSGIIKGDKEPAFFLAFSFLFYFALKFVFCFSQEHASTPDSQLGKAEQFLREVASRWKTTTRRISLTHPMRRCRSCLVLKRD